MKPSQLKTQLPCSSPTLKSLKPCGFHLRNIAQVHSFCYQALVSPAQEFLNVHPSPFYKSLPLQNCFFCWKPTGLQAQTQDPHCPSSNPD